MTWELQRIIACMHLQNKVHINHCEEAVRLARAATLLVLDVCRALSEDASAFDNVVKQTLAVMDKLMNVDEACAQHAPGSLQPVSRPLLESNHESKKHFAFFSLVSLIGDVLQNDDEALEQILISSADFATGKYREPPTIISDVKHGLKFAASPCSRSIPVNPSKQRRVVIDLHAWNDDATVR